MLYKNKAHEFFFRKKFHLRCLKGFWIRFCNGYQNALGLSHNVSLRKDIKNEDFWLVESLLAERVFNENSFIFHACFGEGVEDFEQLNTFLKNLTTIECLVQITDNLKFVIRKILLTDHYTVKLYCFVYFKQTIYYNISPKLNGKSLFEQIILRNYSCFSTFKGTSFISTIILININVCKTVICIADWKTFR